MMTNKERVFAALQHRQPDRTPYRLDFTVRAMEAMVAYCGGDGFLADIDNCIHVARTNPGPKECQLGPELFQDEFGVQWDRSIDHDIGNVCNVAIPERNLDSFEFPPMAGAFDGFADKCAAGGDKCVRFAVGFSLFERAWSLRGGLAELMLDMMEAPSFAEELLDAICDYNVARVREAMKYDVHLVHFGDDWGTQRGLLMSPKMWERFIKPRLARQYAAAKEAGRFVSIHCCGKVESLFDQLIEIGLDCFNPFQPEVMDVYELKRQYAGRLAFWGGISTQKLLPFGTPDEVRAEARRMIREVGRGGGYILSPAHSIPGDAKPENILALIEVVNEG
jgi:uroporphyrinogen decarboxylase